MARAKKTTEESVPVVREPKHARHAKKQHMERQPEEHGNGIDSTGSPEVKSGFSVFNQAPVQEKFMSDTEVKTSRLSKEQREELKAIKAAEREAAKAEREAKKAAESEARALAAIQKAAEREEKRQALAAEKAEKAAARAAARAEREAQAAEGVMLALRSAKEKYVKSATGQLRSTDELATVLDAVPPSGVIEMGLKLLKLETNPYSHLNTGQQSMNLRNKLRGAINKNLVTIADVIALRDAGGYALSEEDLKPKRAAKVEEPEAEIV